MNNKSISRPSAASRSESVVPLFATDPELHRKNAFRVALVGTFAPRKCGIATFTTDIRDQMALHNPEVQLDVYAVDNPAAPHEYEGVAGVLSADDPEHYVRMARQINQSGADAVWIQHEYGIFGGKDGELVCSFVNRLATPLVFTFHTVLSQPSENQRRILTHLVTRASRIMVMSQHARLLTIQEYGASPETVEVIPHGAPDRPFGREDSFKARLGLASKNVIMTFGLLGPGKGLERMIEALPSIVERHPRTVYRIVGATHPNLLALEGERYRDQLQALAERLGVQDHILWDNRFLDIDELLDQIEASDIFVTPYPDMQQSTSGTLSYALALGKAIISTPYVHARELLAKGVGVLAEPNSASALADAITSLLDDPKRLASMKLRAYAKGRGTVWQEFARSCTAMIADAVRSEFQEVPITAVPSLSWVFAMSDLTGMLQHSNGIVPDRLHGYCLDDNARALMLMNRAEGLPYEERLRWSTVYASFVQHAWNGELKRFRNFMNFDRSWCEEAGSEDSNGRALWALGHTVEHAPEFRMRQWAHGWFSKVCHIYEELDAPRTVSFATLGAAALVRGSGPHQGATALLERGGEMLSSLLCLSRKPDWCWFEALLGYDNPRLPQALIEAGVLCRREEWVSSGLETLEWIADYQTAARGHFQPIGSESFGLEYASLPFDQQPLEAWAAIDAARSAYAASGEKRWVDYATTAYRWYFGANDRGIALADLKTGRCRDGLTPRGANENSGAESILAFQLAHQSLMELTSLAKPAISMRRKSDQSDAHPASHPRH